MHYARAWLQKLSVSVVANWYKLCHASVLEAPFLLVCIVAAQSSTRMRRHKWVNVNF